MHGNPTRVHRKREEILKRNSLIFISYSRKPQSPPISWNLNNVSGALPIIDFYEEIAFKLLSRTNLSIRLPCGNKVLSHVDALPVGATAVISNVGRAP
ncbi:hypothetical protein SK128_019676 [Halocaridina rubra]|uniref:Uncharacterized protein n=1 Tax=Halocaridina rubra TaxID=373956 RepID=A0AAN9AFM0_HALRR